MSDTHACSLGEKADKPRCWGLNEHGQLGSAAPPYAFHPTEVQVLAGANDIAVGSGFTCFRKNGQGVQCLGDAPPSFRLYAQPGLDIIDMDAHESGLCVLTGKAQVSCRGEWAPTGSLKVPDGVSVALGHEFACVLLSSGEVRCYGRSEAMEASLNAQPTNPVALVSVPGVVGAFRLEAASQYACALVQGGAVWCWGDTGAPAAIPGIADAVDLAVTDHAICVVTSAGSAQCANFSDKWEVRAISEIENAVSLVGAAFIGDQSTFCAQKKDSTTVCWGGDNNGLRGRGANQYPTPIEVQGIPHVEQLQLGHRLSCALTAANSTDDLRAMHCWGFGRRAPDVFARVQRALIDGEIYMWVPGADDPQTISTQSSAQSQPQPLVGLGKVRSVVGYSVRSYGVAPTGEVFRFEHAAGANSLSKRPVKGLTDVHSLSGSGELVCALHGKGKVSCWIPEELAKRGATAEEPELIELRVEDAIALSVGHRRACVALRRGIGTCWNDIGRDGPVPEPEIQGVRDIATNALRDTCAVLDDGRVTCWQDLMGCDSSGILGRGRFACDARQPAPVVGIDDAVDVEMSLKAACVLRKSGKVSCWGENPDGELGAPPLDASDPPNVLAF